MVSFSEFQKLALSFPEAVEAPHFEKASFRIQKKIFATYDKEKNLACLKFSLNFQDIFCKTDPEAIFPVPNKWGKQGWTLINLNTIKKPLLKDALKTAYQEVSTPPKKSTRNKTL